MRISTNLRPSPGFPSLPGGYLDLAHGECNAILLGHVMAFNYSESEERFKNVGIALGLDLAGLTAKGCRQAVLDEITRLRNAVGITKSLGERGASSSDIPLLAKKAIQDPCMITNPRMPTVRDIEVIYEEAL